jgi:prepilin-type N-terminal cleavage/methylation domain-containing protein
MTRVRIRAGRTRQDGVTLIEMVIAVAVMSVGLFAMAQLFIAATLNTAHARNESLSLQRGHMQIETLKQTAITSGITASAITSSSQTISTAPNPVVMNTYVLDMNGTLVGGGNLPSDLAAVYGPGLSRAPSSNSRLVIVRLVPQMQNSRINNTITLVSVIRDNT